MSDRNEPNLNVDPESQYGWSFYEKLGNLDLAVFVIESGEVVISDGSEEVLRMDAEDAARLARALAHAAEFVEDEYESFDEDDDD